MRVNTMKMIERKIKNGKLVQVSVEFSGSRISKLSITGDFFMHPEDAILDFENLFIGKDVKTLEPNVRRAAAKLKRKPVCIGFSYSDVCSMIKEAWQECGE